MDRRGVSDAQETAVKEKDLVTARVQIQEKRRKGEGDPALELRDAVRQPGGAVPAVESSGARAAPINQAS